MSNRLTVLVVGGAGYIGSHMVYLLGQKGVNVVTLDNLSSGHRDAVLSGRFVYGDISDRLILDQLFRDHRFDAVMHFASFIQVGESIEDPAKYYQNNVVNTLSLLNTMRAYRVDKFIFSSSAAIFGEPEYIPIDEVHPKRPLNPYGRSKLIVEQALVDYEKSYGIKSVSLRYFNAAGAHPDGYLAERHNPETHLIPIVLQVASGQRTHITVFGRDYDTPDGTCIRDYVHVLDLAEAHWLALMQLMSGGKSRVYNLGNGNGFSVDEVIQAACRVTGKSISTQEGLRRDGDPARLVADSSSARKELGWLPQFSELDVILQHGWHAERRRLDK